MNRYLSSFMISIFLYASIFAGVIVFFQKDDNFSDKKIDKPNTVSISMVSIVKQKTPQKKEKIKKVVKKKKPVKKVLKKKPIPKPKKVIPKEQIVQKEPEVVEEVVKEKEPEEKIVKNEQSVQETQEVKQQVVTRNQEVINQDEIKAKQNLFFTKLRNKINENKSYPRSARRRGIQGSVEVKFCVQSDGNVKNVEFVSGKQIFKKSALKAIKDSFPIEVDATLFNFPKEFRISIDYILS